MNKKSHAWGIDLTIAVVIFSIGIAVFYIYSLNQPSEAKENLENLFYDGKILTNTILSDGYPEDWDNTNVNKIGIFSDNKINQTKLENFYGLAQDDYDKTKSLFNTIYDYYFFLDENMIIDSIEIEGVGKPGMNKETIPANAKNLVKITRFTVYEDKPMTAYLYIWN